MSRRIWRKCEYCGVEFETWTSVVALGRGKFCSRRCASRHRYNKPLTEDYNPNSKRVWFRCEVCNKVFTRTPSEAKRFKARWCSYKCASEGRRKEWRGAYCIWCGKGHSSSFQVRWYKGDPYCSEECIKYSQWKVWAEDIFSPLEPDGAYILGFIIADGHLSNKGFRLSMSQKEPDILHKIAVRLRYEGKLYKRSGRVCYTLSLQSKQAHQVLEEKYGIPAGNKSFTVRLPDVSNDLLPHVIRGMFDGDGMVAKGGFPFAYYSGSEGLARDFVEVMVYQVGLSPKELVCVGGYIRKDGTPSVCYQVQWYGRAEAMEFARYIYGQELDVYGSKLFLERKKSRFDILFEQPWTNFEWLRREYIYKGKICSQIAKECGVDKASIGYWVRQFGLRMLLESRYYQCEVDIGAILEESASTEEAWYGERKGWLSRDWLRRKAKTAILYKKIRNWLAIPEARQLKFQVVMQYGLGLRSIEAQLQWVENFYENGGKMKGLVSYLSEHFVSLTETQVKGGWQEIRNIRYPGQKGGMSEEKALTVEELRSIILSSHPLA